MRRLSRYMLFWALGVLSLGGCGLKAHSLAGPSWLRRPNPQEQQNPLRERADVSLSEQTAGAESPTDSRSMGTSRKSSAAESDHLARFDKDTLKLIEEELERTPPAEREQFYQDVMSLEPAMVRQIIRMRRVVRQVGKEAPSQFVSADQMSESASRPTRSRIQLVAGEEPAEGDFEEQTAGHSTPSRPIFGRDPSRDPGLGGADPWNRETPANAPASSGSGANDSSVPPSPLPFNQIPTQPPAGHTAGYGPGNSSSNSNQIQPPPGGALSPIRNAQRTRQPIRRPGSSPQNARIPTEYNPLVPPVPNYAAGGGDPFAGGTAPPVRSASSDPNQKLPGVADSLNLPDSFGPPPAGSTPNASSNASRTPTENSLEEELAQVVAAMQKDVAKLRFADQTTPEQKHAYIQKHVYLRMLYLMAGHEARAVAAIPDIPAPDQEFWQQTFWAMSNYFDIESMPQDDYRATQTIAQLRTAIQKLQENARLELRNVAFCHKITSFGNFDRFPRDEFGPGQPVLVYAEVANFKSTPTTLPNKPNETAYRTQLKSSIEVHRLGPNGELVERFDFEPTEDLCHNHRRDYFHSYEFTIPQRISLGPHVMTLTVEDQLSRKIATYSLNFMVQ